MPVLPKPRRAAEGTYPDLRMASLSPAAPGRAAFLEKYFIDALSDAAEAPPPEDAP